MEYIVILAIVVLVGGFATAVCVQEEINPLVPLGLSALVIIVLSIGMSITAVPSGHVGLVKEFGAIVDQVGEGVTMTAPWSDLEEVSVRTLSFRFEDMGAFSKESQDVYVEATLNTQVSPQFVQKLYREVGPDYFNILIRPRVLQAFKDETVLYTSVEIAPNRESIRQNVRKKLEAELAPHSITVQDLLIDEIRFSKQFQEAIEEKQKQTQLALAEQEKVKSEKSKAEQAVERAKGQADSVLIAAKKQAEANKVLAESLTPAYLNYLYVEKLSPQVKVMMLPSNAPFILDAKTLTP